MEIWLANGGSSSSSPGSILLAVISAAVAAITLVISVWQWRRSLRDHVETSRADAELDKQLDRRRKDLLARLEEARADLDRISQQQEETKVDPGRAKEATENRLLEDKALRQIRSLTVQESSVLAEETQYEIVRKYHHQGLAQSRISFWFSLIFASLGFLVIATALLTINRDLAFTQQSASIISLLAGTIIESVASLFFVQSRRAQQVMQEFFDRLRKDRSLEESLKLTDKVADPELQGKLQALLAVKLAEVNAADSILSAVLKVPASVTEQVTGQEAPQPSAEPRPS